MVGKTIKECKGIRRVSQLFSYRMVGNKDYNRTDGSQLLENSVGNIKYECIKNIIIIIRKTKVCRGGGVTVGRRPCMYSTGL